MTIDEFDAVVARRLERVKHTLVVKGREYQRGDDRLSNFKNSGATLRSTPEDALLGQWVKHVTSIIDLVQDLREGKVATRATWDEKLGDAINYLILLEGLTFDRLDDSVREVGV